MSRSAGESAGNRDKKTGWLRKRGDSLNWFSLRNLYKLIRHPTNLISQQRAALQFL